MMQQAVATTDSGERYHQNPRAGSPWERVENEHGQYYYNSLTQVPLTV